MSFVMAKQGRQLHKSKEEAYATSSLLQTEDGKIYQPNKLHLLTQFVVLGISRYTDVNSVIQTIDILKEFLKREEVKDVVTMLENISKCGNSINQNALLLCLVKCYLHDPVSKDEVNRVIQKICRIPTHLFMLLKLLHEDDDSRLYYKSLLKSLGSNTEKTNQNKGQNKKKGKKTSNSRNNPSEHDTVTEKLETIVGSEVIAGKCSTDTPEYDSICHDGDKDEKKVLMKISSFVPKHKFAAAWYKDPNKRAEDLLYLLTKYKARHGWDHKMILKYTHVKIPITDEEKEDKDMVIQYYLGGKEKIDKPYKKFQRGGVMENQEDQDIQENRENWDNRGDQDDENVNRSILRQNSSRILAFIEILEEAKSNKDNPQEVIKIIRRSQRRVENIVYTTARSRQSCCAEKYSRLHIPIELLPDELYKNKEVWEEIIKDMPMTALLKHISHMSYLELFDKEENINYIKGALTNKCRIYPFIHPFQILKALIAYQVGCPRYKHASSSKTWNVNQEILEILHEALALSFQRKVKKLKFKKCVICIDVSYPMKKIGFLGFDMFTAAMVSVVIATMIQRFEESTRIFLCGTESRLLEKETLTGRMEEIRKCLDNESDLSLPIKQACEDDGSVDAFIVFTKSTKESMCGESAYTAFKKYREVKKEKDTKLVICSMEANNCLIADPNDCNVFTVCGGDAEVLPNIHNILNPDDTNSSFDEPDDHNTSPVTPVEISPVHVLTKRVTPLILKYDDDGASMALASPESPDVAGDSTDQFVNLDYSLPFEKDLITF